jgi:outer membrane protein OmpA-like peptidoglycan-associated protein
MILASIVLSCIGVGFAQLDTPANAVPDQVDGKDYAGRPVSNVKIPAVPALPSSERQQFQQDVKDVHFDFDQADLRAEDRVILASDAQWLKAHPEVLVTLAGEADERGDIVYNVVLSDRRAIATRDALVELGVPANRIVFATGWGKLYPICSQSDESCWSQNRRTHIEPWEPVPQPTQVAAR